MANFDLVLRGGMVFDGCGGAGQEADIAVKNGRIAALGRVTGVGAEEIDARGHIVTPGFVDVHTHYDGQATWDARLTPSSWHGVTTVVMGNCGVGFAPCRPADHQRLMRLMEGVEDIPEPVLMEGLPWNWESFPDYLDALDARPHDIDFAAQLAHGPLRVYVMGERGANRDPATAEDVARMAALAREAVEAGALGFSTSRTINHVTSEGKPTPTLDAAREELIGIAAGLKAAGKGVLQLISDFRDPDYELALLRDMAASSGRPLSFSLAQFDTAPDMWRDLLGALDGWAAEGLDIRGQVCGRAVGVVFGLDLSAHPLLGYPSYRAIEGLPFDRRLAALRDPAFRKRILSETADGLPPLLEKVVARFDKMFPLGDPPDYEPKGECSISALARARGQSPLETALDLMLERDGKAQLYLPFLNYSDMSLDPSYEMMRHPRTILGLGDAGAHVSQICDASFSTYMLTHWTRDRVRGPKLPLEWVIRAHTKDTAEAMGLFDRGVLKPGYKADLNVIDYDRLHLHAPEVVYDLPNGGRRLIQQADGYEATIVSGTVIWRGGRPTDALPGRLIRGSQAAPG